MDEKMHFVDFEKYCKTCAHKDKKESEEPCDDCLTIPARNYSSKPERYTKK